MALDAGFTYVPVNPGWDAVVENLSLVPVVAAALGPTVGLGAARLVMSHLAVLVEGLGQLFVAGPPVVRGGTGEDLTKEELGGADVHRRSGAVERIVATEDEAFAVVRTFLSYLPDSVFGTPPVTAAPIRPAGGTSRCSAPCRGIRAGRTGSARSSRRSSTRARCSGTPSTAARRSPPWPGWPGSRSA